MNTLRSGCKRSILSVMAASVLILAASPLRAQDLTFTRIAFPGVAARTAALGINAQGQVVGWYDTNVQTHGYVLDRGEFTTIDPPGSGLTQARGINSRGQIVGFFAGGNGTHGFLYDRGEFSTIDVPGAVRTIASGINSQSQIVGEYEDINGIVHGYLLSHGVFTTIDAVPEAIFTRASGINSQGQIVGVFTTGTIGGGFLWDNGAATPIDFPSLPNNGFIFDVTGINARGQIVGGFVDDFGNHGFLFEDGVLTPIDAIVGMTIAVGINSHGQIVGFMGDHGFIAE
jgi:probable HAF family extracellular repeat protein